LSADALEVAGVNLAGLGFINSDVRIAQGSWVATVSKMCRSAKIWRNATASPSVKNNSEQQVACWVEGDLSTDPFVGAETLRDSWIF